MNKRLVTVASICLLVLLALTLTPACSPTEPTPSPTSAPAASPTPAAQPTESPTQATGIVWKGVTMSPSTGTGTYCMKELSARVNNANQGLTINYMGGPEVIPMFDQPTALSDGVVDIAWLPEAYFMRRVPPAYAASLCMWSVGEEQDHGIVDFFRKIMAPVNIYYLGKGSVVTGFYFLTREKMNGPEDLAGKKFPAGPSTVPAFKAVGAVSVDMEDAEIYSAIDRGVLDGSIDPLGNLGQLRLGEVAHYLIDHPFYNPHTGMLINLDSWNALPPNLQKLVQDTFTGMIPELEAYFAKMDGENRQKLLDQGVTAVKWPDDVAQKFLDSLYDTHWQMVKDYEGITPEMYEEMHSLFVRD